MKNQKTLSIIKKNIPAIIVAGLILLSASCFGQDTIYMFDQTKLAAKVTEISQDEVKYKKIDFIDGPSYLLNKYDVSAIRYSNGIVDSFPYVKPWYRPAKKVAYDTVKYVANNNVPQENEAPSFVNNKITIRGGEYAVNSRKYNYKQMGTYLANVSNDKVVKRYVFEAEKAKKLRYLGFVAIPVGVAGLLAAAVDNEPVYVLAGAVGATVFISISANRHKAQKDNIRMAVNYYNKQF